MTEHAVDPSVHLIICGIPGNVVEACVRTFAVSWQVEPVATTTEELQIMLGGDQPAIQGGKHNLFVIADRAGPTATVAGWLAAMASRPTTEITPVLVSTQTAATSEHHPTDDVLAAHPLLDQRSSRLPPGRITIHQWSSTEASAGGFVAALLAALPSGVAAGLTRPDTLPTSGLLERYPPRQLSGPLPVPIAAPVQTQVDRQAELAESPSAAPVAAASEPGGQWDALPMTAGTPLVGSAAPSVPEATECHVLMITSTKGGVGKSSVSLAVAAYVGSQWNQTIHTGRYRPRVCIVDFDLDSPSLAVMTATSTPTMAPLCLEPVIDPQTVAQYVIPVPHLHLDVLNAPALPQEARLLTVTMVRAIMRSLTELYDIVVIDADKLDWDPDGIQRPLVDVASQVVVVADPVLTSVRGLALVRDVLCGETGYSLSASHVGVVWNRVHNQLGLPFRDIERRTGLTHLQYLPDTAGDHARAINATRFHLILRDRPDWAARIHLLAETLFGPGTVVPITRAVANLLPVLHRNGETRGELRVHRRLLGRIRLRTRFAQPANGRETK